ncbi:MAG TPA: hypothetical protein VGG75_34900 [Trebonia sp.]|jgi:hypothetical protein
MNGSSRTKWAFGATATTALAIGLLGCTGSGSPGPAASSPASPGQSASDGASGASDPSGSHVSGTTSQTGKWSCTATDNGDQNPGGNCPAGGSGYVYRGITNSNGYNTMVINDMWNPPGPGHPQAIYVNNPGDWKAVSDMPAGNTAVLSYPNVQQVFTQTTNAPAPLSKFRSITSDFAESMPHNGDNEAAYDIWMGTSAKTDYKQEIMIWVDNHRTNPPPGSVVGKPVFGGATYTVWNDSGTIYMLRDGNETSGTVDVLAMLNWLVQKGLSPKGSGLNQVDFGWEICSTDGKPETFVMTDYHLKVACASSGTSCWSS